MQHDNKKKYIDIYERVRRDIIEGIYAYNEKLPSKRVMSEREDVSVITVEHAYELLTEEGYIIPREKSGYFVSYDPNLSFTAHDSNMTSPIVSHSTEEVEESTDMRKKGIMPFSFSIYAKTVRQVLSEYSEEVVKRSPGYGCTYLRKVIARYLARSRRINVDYDRIIIGAGAEYLYGLIVQTFGRNIAYGIESPSYQKIAKVYTALGAKINMLPLGTDGIESSALWKCDAKVLHITPYRSYPTGVTATAAKKHEYLRWSNEKDSIIVEDDFESEFTPSRKAEETLFSMCEDDRVIYVNTFTQTIGSHVRIAYMVIPERLKKTFADAVGFYACPVPTLDQYVLAGLIENGDFERHINRVRRQNRRK